MKLVMIGTFKEPMAAASALETLKAVNQLVTEETGAGAIVVGEVSTQFSDTARKKLSALNVYSLNPTELEQFAYDVSYELEGGKVVVTTDESDVSAFLKLLIDAGAKVEVFSKHEWPLPDAKKTAPKE